MKDENEYVTDRCRQLADMAVGLLSKVQDLQTTTQRSTAQESLPTTALAYMPKRD